MRSMYQKIIDMGNFFQPILLLAMRLFWGFAFFQAGLGKVNDPSSVIKFFTKLGIYAPDVMGPLVAWVELVGGLLLVVGFASRLAAIPLGITMIVALLTAHLSSINSPETFLAQSPVTFLMVCLVIFSFGPGSISIDHLFTRKGK